MDLHEQFHRTEKGGQCDQRIRPLNWVLDLGVQREEATGREIISKLLIKSTLFAARVLKAVPKW